MLFGMLLLSTCTLFHFFPFFLMITPWEIWPWLFSVAHGYVKWIFLRWGLGKLMEPTELLLLFYFVFKNLGMCFLRFGLGFFSPLSFCFLYLVEFWFPPSNFSLMCIPLWEGSPGGWVLRVSRCVWLQIVWSSWQGRAALTNTLRFHPLCPYWFLLSSELHWWFYLSPSLSPQRPHAVAFFLFLPQV